MAEGNVCRTVIMLRFVGQVDSLRQQIVRFAVSLHLVITGARSFRLDGGYCSKTSAWSGFAREIGLGSASDAPDPLTISWVLKK